MCTAASRATTEATVGWNPTRAGSKLDFCGATFPWTNCHCTCTCVTLGVECHRELGAELRCYFWILENLYAFITKRVLVLFPWPPHRYMRRLGPWKAPARALSLHVSTRLCNRACLGTAPLILLMFWTSCSCHFLSYKPWCWRRVTASNCPGRRGRKNLLEGSTRDCWCVTQSIHQMFF